MGEVSYMKEQNSSHNSVDRNFLVSFVFVILLFVSAVVYSKPIAYCDGSCPGGCACYGDCNCTSAGCYCGCLYSDGTWISGSCPI